MKKANNFQILKVQSQGIISWEKLFFWKNMFFTKYTLFAEKMFLYGKKVLYWKFFLLKKTFFTEKNINENVKIYIYLFWEMYFYVENVCYKYKSFYKNLS